MFSVFYILTIILSKNVVRAYSPQVGCEERENKEVWQEMDEMKQKIPENKDAVIGGDINGYWTCR